MEAGWNLITDGDQQVVVMYVVDSNTGARSEVQVQCFGAHVKSWTESTQECPLLFLSEHAILDGSKAIRGGIPIIFPQFSGRGPLKSHGFGRISTWSIDTKASSPEKSEDASSCSVVFTLSDKDLSESFQQDWNSRFTTRYTVTLTNATSSELKCNWDLLNENDSDPIEFTCALHTYFAVGHISNTSVHGLLGHKYVDQLLESKEFEEKNQDGVVFNQEVDRIYANVPNQLIIQDTKLNRAIAITSENLPDAVVWNPWIAKSKRMGDFGDDEYLNMVCVEGGSILSPVQLQAGDVWTASSVFTHSSLETTAGPSKI